MAQLDFPTSPQVNDTYTANGITYTWDGTKWDGAVIISGGSSGGSTFSTTVTAPELQANNTGNASVLLDLQRAGDTQFSITAEPNININSACDILLNDADGQALRVMQGTDEYMRFNTSTQTIITKNALEIDGALNIDAAVDCSGDVTFSDAQTILIPDNLGFGLRVGSSNDTGGFGAEYVRFKTTDGEEEIDFSKKLKIDGQIDINSDINILQPNSGQVDINIPASDGNALRIMGGGTELFRFSTNVGPEIADFTCATKFDGAINVNSDVTMIQNECDVTLKEGSSNALDFVDGGTNALRFNTNTDTIIIDYNLQVQNNHTVKFSNYTFPATDGGANQVLATNGSGQLSFVTVATGDVTGATETQGTFTATLAGTTSNPSVSQTTTGNYIRIGNLVTVYIAFHNMAATGGAGTVQITGLPFNIENLSSGSGGQYTEPVGSVWFDKDVLFDTTRTVNAFGVANSDPATIQFVAQGTQGFLPYQSSPGSGMRLELQLSYVTDAS